METHAANPPARRLPPAGLDLAGVQWTLRDVLFGMLWFFALILVLPLPFALPAAGIWGAKSVEFFAVSLVLGAFAEAALIAVAAFYTFRKYGGSWERLGFRNVRWSLVGWSVAAVVGAFAIAAAWTGIIALFDLDAFRPEHTDQVPQEVFDSRLLLVIMGVVVIGFAPICEEVFFRGFIFPGIARSWGAPAGVVLSALFFSVAHVSPNMHKTFVPILGIGLVFALVYWRSGSLLSSVGAHLFFNIISFAVLVAED